MIRLRPTLKSLFCSRYSPKSSLSLPPAGSLHLNRREHSFGSGAVSQEVYNPISVPGSPSSLFRGTKKQTFRKKTSILDRHITGPITAAILTILDMDITTMPVPSLLLSWLLLWQLLPVASLGRRPLIGSFLKRLVESWRTCLWVTQAGSFHRKKIQCCTKQVIFLSQRTMSVKRIIFPEMHARPESSSVAFRSGRSAVINPAQLRGASLGLLLCLWEAGHSSHLQTCHKPTATSTSQASAVTMPINIVSISFPKKQDDRPVFCFT